MYACVVADTFLRIYKNYTFVTITALTNTRKIDKAFYLKFNKVKKFWERQT